MNVISSNFISVIICTHNPRKDFLERVLLALKNQSLSVDRWELILVDNQSSIPLTNQYDISWHPSSRIVAEKKLGLTHARLRGISESKGEILIFVDDDNVLKKDYLERCIIIKNNMPILGAWGGSTVGEFEGKIPEWLIGREWLLGVRNFEKDIWSNSSRDHESHPIGAGMVLMRDVAMRYLELASSCPLRSILGRSGSSLLSGEDNDMAMCAIDLGLGCGVFKSLSLTHLIPRERMSYEYVKKIARGIAASGVVLEYIRMGRTRTKTIILRVIKLIFIAIFSSKYNRGIKISSWKGINDGELIVKKLRKMK